MVSICVLPQATGIEDFPLESVRSSQLPNEALPIHATQLQGIDSGDFCEATGRVWRNLHVPDIRCEVLFPVCNGGN